MHHADKQACREAERSEAELTRTLQEVARLNTELNKAKADAKRNRDNLASVRELILRGHPEKIILETMDALLQPSPQTLGETPLYAEVW